MWRGVRPSIPPLPSRVRPDFAFALRAKKRTQRTFDRRIVILYKAILHELDRQRGFTNTFVLSRPSEKKTVQVSPKMNGVGKAPVVRSLPAPGGPGAGPRRTDFSHNQILTAAPNDDELVFAQELGKG